MVELSPFELCWRLKYVFFADQAGKVNFKACQVSKNPATEVRESLTVSVKNVKNSIVTKKSMRKVQIKALGSTEFSVDVPKRGFYVLEANAARSRLLLEAADVPVAVYVGDQQQLALVGGRQDRSVWAYVPESSKAVAFVTKGGSDSDLGARLVAPDGKVAAENRQIENWAVLQRQSPVAGLWQIDILKPQRGYRKYFYLDLTGVPGLLWLSKEKTFAFGDAAK